MYTTFWKISAKLPSNNIKKYTLIMRKNVTTSDKHWFPVISLRISALRRKWFQMNMQCNILLTRMLDNFDFSLKNYSWKLNAEVIFIAEKSARYVLWTDL